MTWWGRIPVSNLTYWSGTAGKYNYPSTPLENLIHPLRTPMPLVDAEGRTIGILAGQPEDPTWDQVQNQAALCLEEARSRCHFSSDGFQHRRGAFPTLRCGVSHGGGQIRPQNLKNGARNQKVLDEINSHPSFKRIAGFGSGD